MAPDLGARAKQVLNFWLGEGWETAGPDDTRPGRFKIWFGGGPELDAEIVEHFSGDCDALIRGELDAWEAQPFEALAGIIVGDQLTRNAYRGTARMYQADSKVLAWAKRLVAAGTDHAALKPIQRVWIYMPFMHSEELEDQKECVRLFESLQSEAEAAGCTSIAGMAANNIKYAKAHEAVVAQWGRFPHRNAILGRESTPEEAAGIAAGTIPKW